jgi:hypothetical protein
LQELRVIHNKETISERYKRAYGRKMKDLMENGLDKQKVKQAILLGVKMVVTQTHWEKENDRIFSLEFFQAFMELMSCLTPKELMNLFPIDKEYDGEKYGIKDYYSTINELIQFPQDEPIGNDIFGLLLDYHNNDIRRFCVRYLTALSDRRRSLGGRDIAEEFFEGLGVSPLYQNKDKGYLYNPQTQKTVPCKTQVNYLRRIK